MHLYWKNVFLSLYTSITIIGLDAVEVEISTPVNPVETGAIFSVLCQVRGLNKTHEVALYRTTGSNEPQRLSSKENVDTEIDERVFLAVRRQTDGSEVYFLTITDFGREDVGEYSCKVIRTSPKITEVGSDYIRADLLYFPSSSDPQCSNSGDPIILTEGSILDLNCSSEIGNPTVSIAWTRAGKSYSNGAVEDTIGNRIYSSISLTITMENNGDIFLCEIESMIEPYQRNCHAGPIKVISGPDNEDKLKHASTHFAVTTSHISHITISQSNPETNMVARSCKDLCRKQKPKPWIIATIITAVIAMVLLLIIITVSAKSGRVSRERSTQSIYQRSPDDIYTELQYRKGDFMYVPVEKSKAMLEDRRTDFGDGQ